MSVMTIKPAFLNALKNDSLIKQKLAERNEVSLATIERWLRGENMLLTAATNLSLIKDHFGLLEASEILESRGVEKV